MSIFVLIVLSAGLFRTCYPEPPSDAVVIDRWVQDSLDLQAWQVCRKKVPEFKLSQVSRLNIYDRTVMIRDYSKRWNITCTTNDGRIMRIDTGSFAH